MRLLGKMPPVAAHTGELRDHIHLRDHTITADDAPDAIPQGIFIDKGRRCRHAPAGIPITQRQADYRYSALHSALQQGGMKR